MSEYKCIVTITKRGKGNDVIDAARRKKAKGSTLIKGKGVSVFEHPLLKNLMHNDKDIVITLIPESDAENVKNEIRHALDIDTPGEGVIFVFDALDVVGLDVS